MLGLVNGTWRRCAIFGASLLALLFTDHALARKTLTKDQTDRVRAAMHLRDFKVQDIAAPPVVGDPRRGIVTIPLTLDGQAIKVRLAAQSLRSADFQLLSRGA